MHEGFKEIHLYGVDMAVSTEYDEQRPSCEYFIGLARGRGIKVYIPEESHLLKVRYKYGYEAKSESVYRKNLKQRKQICEAGRDDAAAGEANHREVKNQYIGAIAALEELLREL
jgi:hypothetical protein